MPPKRTPTKSKTVTSSTSSPIATTSATISTPPRTPAPDALPLPAFLKLLCSSPSQPLTMSEAIQIAKLLVPAKLNSPSRLSTLTQTEMVRLGITDEELRKKLLQLTLAKKGGNKRKKKGSDLDRPLPDRLVQQELVEEDLDFEEIVFEEALIKKSCITNRAPVMSAWAMIVAERLGFKRQEALSIAQVYTEMNASSKGVSLGIMPESALNNHIGSSQPFVDLMGRKVPVLSTSTGEWRAISKGVVADPQKAFAYIQRAFRQQAGAIIGGSSTASLLLMQTKAAEYLFDYEKGALRLLAESFEPVELNAKGYGLYIEFRPEVKEWGEKSELQCTTILDLRRHLTHVERAVEPLKMEERAVKIEDTEGNVSNVARIIQDVEAVKPALDAMNDSLEGRQNGQQEDDEFDKLLDDDEGIDFEALDA